jgi:hypothetical protein
MRRIFWCFCVILLSVLISGCLQPAPPTAPVATSTPAPEPAITLPPATLPTATPVQKQVNFTISEKDTQLIVRLDGGRDAADLTSLLFRIQNQNGQYIERTRTGTTVGVEYVFNYRGDVDAMVVNIIGTFRDGTEQTVLMAYL